MAEQHDCARIGCTRLTSEQKEPRGSATRQCIVCTLPSPTTNYLCNSCWESYKEIRNGSIMCAVRWAADRVRAPLAAERDAALQLAKEESARARKAESLAAEALVGRASLDIELDEIAVALGYAEEHEGYVMRAPQSTLLRVIGENARAVGKAEGERDNAGALLVVVCPTCGPCKSTDEDGCCNRCGVDTFFRLSSTAAQDPRIETWRGLDGAEREITAVMLRGFGFGTLSSWPTEAGCEIAAAALEALGEKP